MDDLSEYEKEFGGVIGALQDMPHINGHDIVASVMTRLDGCENVVESLQAFPPVSCADITERVMSEVGRIRAKERIFARIFSILRSAAAVAVVSVAGWYVASWMQEPAEVPASEIAGYIDVEGVNESVLAAEWLMKTQRADGTWAVESLGGRKEYAPALTALAVAAMHKQNDRRFDSAVLRGMKALVEMRDEGGRFGEGATAAWNNEIATGVISMLCSDCGIDGLKLGAGRSSFGWDYVGAENSANEILKGIASGSENGNARAYGAVGGRIYRASVAALRGRLLES